MRVLFITTHQYLPQLRGGVQSSTHELCGTLKQRGHRVAVLAGFTRDGLFAWGCRIQKKVLHRSVSRDTFPGYPVWRSWSPPDEVEYVAEKERPDVIVVMDGESVRMALAAKRTQIPVLMQLQSVELQTLNGRFQDLGSDVSCVANSHFTAETYHNAFGVHPKTIYPYIALDRYRTKTTKENITFINPHPVKGRDIALEVARLCPGIPFRFVESWPLSDDHRQQLNEKLAALPNVTLLPPQKEMRRVYGKCKVLLVPSVWEEAYGRVVTEAQISGIPVVASDRGGLPESVGQGGILLDPSRPIDHWVHAVRKLWHDDQCYAELSAAATVHAERPENSLARKWVLWEQALLEACGAPTFVSDRIARIEAAVL